MLRKITKNIDIKELIFLGAQPDGKIVQQAILLKKGIDMPKTYVFDHNVAKDNLHKVHKLSKEKDIVFQIRTETINETNRSKDSQSESRLDITPSNLEQQILEIINIMGGQFIGLIQELPSGENAQNLLAGIGSLSGNEYVVDLHFGYATYIARLGYKDVQLRIDSKKTELVFSDLETIKRNLEMDIKRLGLNRIKIEYPQAKLPYNNKKRRIKKEYELTSNELNQCISKYILNKESNLSLNDYLLKKGNELIESIENHAIAKIKVAIKDDMLSTIISEELIRLIADTFRKVGKEILRNHLCSFSIIVNNKNNTDTLIVWDLPLDSSLIETQRIEIPDDLVWVRDLKDVPVVEQDYIGIDLPVTEDLSIKLDSIRDELRNVTTIFVKYASLSHPATILREKGYKVISI